MSLFKKASNYSKVVIWSMLLGRSNLTPSFLQICWDFSTAMLCPNKIFHEHLPCKNHHNQGPWCLCWDLRLRNAMRRAWKLHVLANLTCERRRILRIEVALGYFGEWPCHVVNPFPKLTGN